VGSEFLPSTIERVACGGCSSCAYIEPAADHDGQSHENNYEKRSRFVATRVSTRKSHSEPPAIKPRGKCAVFDWVL
jgi:hypothetical protein